VAKELARKRRISEYAVFSRDGVMSIVDYKSRKAKEKILAVPEAVK